MDSKILNYTSTPPLTFEKRIKRIEMLPTGTYNQSLNQQDIVRFYFKSAKDLIDPWSIQIQIEITIPDNILEDDTKFHYKMMQLDGSASSFIQNMVIYDPQGREIERINQYSRLADFLNQMKYNPQEKSGSDQQGMGGLNLGQFGSNVSGPIPTLPQQFYKTGIRTSVYPSTGTDNINLNYDTNLWENEQSVYNWGEGFMPVTLDINNYTYAPLIPGFNGEQTLPILANGVTQTEGQVTLEESKIIGPLSGKWNINNLYLQSFGSLTYLNSTYINPPIVWGAPNSDDADFQKWVLGVNNAEQSSNQWLNGSIPDAYVHLWAIPNNIQYWSPIRSNSLFWQLSPYFASDSALSAGPLGSMNGAPPCTVSMADAYFGTGLAVGSFGKQITDPSVLQNNTNSTYIWKNKTSQTNWPPGLYEPNATQENLNSYTLFNGFSSAFPANFAVNCFEPRFSKRIKQRVLKNGVPSDEYITSWQFNIPLMSGFIGSLITPERYKLIPMAILNDVVVEFYFNPYALFTSYWSSSVQNRGYLIKDIRLTMETMVIEDQAISSAVLGQINNWTFPTHSYYLGPQYSISANNLPPEIQFNLGFKSLRGMYWGFYRSLYSKTTAARYTYRLSGNLTSYYIQYGTENYPSIPVSGIAGNNYGANNNYTFYYELLKAMDCQHTETDKGINIHNFAINYSEIEPANFELGDNLFNNRIQALNKQLIEGDDQLCFFYENRMRGACMYGLDCQTMNYDQTAFSGIDTSTNKPFSLFMEYDNSNPYPGNMEFISWCNYDCIISKTEDGFTVWGRT